MAARYRRSGNSQAALFDYDTGGGVGGGGHAPPPTDQPGPPVDASADSVAAMREQLRELARSSGAARTGLVDELSGDDVADCAGESKLMVMAYLRAIQATADRQLGFVPAGERAGLLCDQCGPVWTTPDLAARMPRYHGWPRASGCPWCLVAPFRRRGPMVRCDGCVHFAPNDNGGRGQCGLGHGRYYPAHSHFCGDFSPVKPMRQ